MSKLSISERAKLVETSQIWGLFKLADKAKQKGNSVYHLNIGNPDIVVPESIRNSLRTLASAVERIPYPPARGQKALLESWRKYFSDIEIPVAIDTEDMVVTAGGGEAMILSAVTLLNLGDEYILFEPFYQPYITCGVYAGAKPVAVELDKENNYHLPTKQKIVEKITSRTKVIFFTNPNNPTGTVFTKKEIQLILEIAQEYNLFIICDEAYRGIVFDGKENLSILHLATKEQLQHIVIIDSLSKRLSVCGARMGLVLSKNHEIASAILRFVECQPLAAFIEQEIVTEMLGESLGYLEWLKDQYQKRRDAFITTFEKEMGEQYPKPEGAFYTMFRLPVDDTTKFVSWMMTDFSESGETVLTSPDFGFYLDPAKGKKEIRVAYVLDEDKLQKAARILAHGVKAYQKGVL